MQISSKLMAMLQGFYFFTTAIWPFIRLPSFLFVTGPKTDIWLLYTVSTPLLVIGLVLLLAGLRNSVTLDLKLLAMASASGLILIDIVYSSNNTIADIYRYDAAAEIILLAGWAFAEVKGGEKRCSKMNLGEVWQKSNL